MPEPIRVTAASATAESEIHDLGYRRYEGGRDGVSGAWRALFWQGFRAMFGLGRGAKAKLVPMFVIVVSHLPALAMVAAASAAQGMLKVRYGQIVSGSIPLIMLFAAAQTPEILSRDQQHRVLPLILTRDITRFSYATARYASMVLALFLVALGPLLLLYIGEIGGAPDPSKVFAVMGTRIFPILAQASLTAFAVGGIAAALSAWTPRRAYATAAIIAFFLVSAAISSALDDIAGVPRRVAELANPIGAIQTQAMLFFGETTRRMERLKPMSLAVHAALLTSLGIAGATVLWLRIRRVSA